MSLSLPTRIMIWALAGRICSKPGCNRPLIAETDQGSRSLIGEIAHIKSPKPDGPRHDSSGTIAFDEFDNLLLLCQEHHKIIDDHPSEYTAELLTTWKNTHQNSILNRLSETDRANLDKKVQMAGYIDSWADQAKLTNWNSWTASIFIADEPKLSEEKYNLLNNLNTWLLGRIWPPGMDQFKIEFENFRRILNDFLHVFSKHSVLRGKVYWTDKFYKHPVYEPERYQRQFREWLFHSKLVQDLCLELTRSANKICDLVRASLQSDFRLAEGVLLITSGPYMDLTDRTYRTEYRDGEKYDDVESFLQIRETRDLVFGAGLSSEDSTFRKSFSV